MRSPARTPSRLARFTFAVAGAFALSAGAADAPASSGLSRQGEHLSNEQRLDRTSKTLGEMRKVLEQTQKLVEQARNEKDIVKLNCVNEKLAQVRGLLKVSEGSEVELREAVGRKEEDSAEHEFTKIAIAGRKVAGLRQDAEQCIGQLAYYNDEKTLVDVEIPAGLPQQDPTWVPVPPGVILRQPQASSY